MWKYEKLRITMITTTIGRQVLKHVGLQGTSARTTAPLNMIEYSKRIMEKTGRRLLSFYIEKNNSK